MKFSFHSSYDGELNYDLFENGVTTFSSVLLRAAQEDTFSTHMRDVFMHQLAIKCFPTLLAQDYKYTVLYITANIGVFMPSVRRIPPTATPITTAMTQTP